MLETVMAESCVEKGRTLNGTLEEGEEEEEEEGEEEEEEGEEEKDGKG